MRRESSVTRAIGPVTRGLAALLGAVVGLGIASAAAALALRPRLSRVPDPGADEIELGAVFGSLDFRSEAPAFRGGRVMCWYAGVDLDLRGATLDAAGADLLVWTVFGGTGIRVPEDWPVDSRGIALFGGAGSSARAPGREEGGPVLRVRHRTLFGGFGLVARPDEGTAPV